MKTLDIPLKAKLFRGLADPSRLAVLEALRDGALSVNEVVRRTRLTQPNVSMHLGCLAECGLVIRERQGRFVHYEVADKRVVKLLDQVEELLGEVGGFVAACARYGRPERWPPRARRAVRPAKTNARRVRTKARVRP
jgi:DNA-binding transcriptional ArsR family regulator